MNRHWYKNNFFLIRKKFIWLFILFFSPFLILFIFGIINVNLWLNSVNKDSSIVFTVQIITWAFNFIFPTCFLFFFFFKQYEYFEKKERTNIKKIEIEKWLNIIFLFPIENKKKLEEIEKYFSKISCVSSFENNLQKKEQNFYHLSLFKISFYQNFKNYRDHCDQETKKILDQINFNQFCSEINLLSKFNLQLNQQNLNSKFLDLFIYLK